jgi:hypothetical protein
MVCGCFYWVFVASRAAIWRDIAWGRKTTMPYEDNFGFYCADDDPEELAFFNYIRSQSTAKKCVRCKQMVRLLPQNILCATCSQSLEYGAPSDPAWAVAKHWLVG